ncbi:MAG: hypothetical protein JWN65_922 [Solirubrobacterales bacterium]|nr:hypothetical protein [Solirubrobacterales bacterium]
MRLGTGASRFLIGLVTLFRHAPRAPRASAALATRYDKHAIVYRGGLVLAAVLPGLTDLGETS